MHRSLYYEKQRGLSLIAFDGNNSESEGDKLHDPVAGGTQNCQIDFLPLISSLVPWIPPLNL